MPRLNSWTVDRAPLTDRTEKPIESRLTPSLREGEGWDEGACGSITELDIGLPSIDCLPAIATPQALAGGRTVSVNGEQVAQ